MKVIIFLNAIFFVGHVACNDSAIKNEINQGPAYSERKNLQLIDSLGTVSLFLPLRYDTSFSWIHEGDCGKSCDQQKYRSQPKAIPIFPENGFIPDWPKDSVENFTIIHSMELYFHNTDTTKSIGRYNFLKARHNSLKEDLLYRFEGSNLVYDTIQKINDRYFSVFAIEKSDSFQLRKVTAKTTIKNNEIYFQFDLLTKQKDSISINFIKNSIDLIKTIRISKGI